MGSSKSGACDAGGYPRLTLQQAERVVEIKREMEGLLEDGLVSEEAKEKLRRSARLRPDLFGDWENI